MNDPFIAYLIVAIGITISLMAVYDYYDRN